MKEWVLIRLTSIILVLALVGLPWYYSSTLVVLGVYLVLAYHLIHGLVSIIDDYVQNETYRSQFKFVLYLSCIFLFKVIAEISTGF